MASKLDAISPQSIVTSSLGLFWTNRDGGTVMHLPAAGGSPEKLANATHPRAIAVTASRLYWTDDEGLWSCDLAGCAASAKKLASGAATGSIQGVAADEQQVFWTDHGDDPSTSTGVVSVCPVADCSSPTTLASKQFVPHGIVLVGGSMMWTNLGNGNENGQISKIAKSGASGALTIAAVLNLPTAIVADDTYVYWTDATSSGHVLRCPHTMGYCDAPEQVTETPQKLLAGLSLLGGRVYWSSTDAGLLQSCPASGCTAATLAVHAKNRAGIRGIAATPGCLFWVDDEGGGSVSRVGR